MTIPDYLATVLERFSGPCFCPFVFLEEAPGDVFGMLLLEVSLQGRGYGRDIGNVGRLSCVCLNAHTSLNHKIAERVDDRHATNSQPNYNNKSEGHQLSGYGPNTQS